MKKTEFYFFILFWLSIQFATGQTVAKVNPEIRYQQMKGWGASLCWWANKAGGFNDAKVDEICKLITSPDELNMNVFRYNIGGGDNPAHNHLRADGGAVPGFKASANAAYDWNQDARQRKILLKLNSLRTDVINEAFSNSPPYWMTKSGCVSGNTDGSDNLKDDQYGVFADYLTEVVKTYKEKYNITFHTLTPFNEPFSNWWKANGGQEGCRFSQSNQQKMILELHTKMSQKRILNHCAISAMDANSIDEAVNGINAYATAGNILSKINQINTHSYSGSKRTELYALAKKYGKELWQSETGPLSVSATGLANHLIVAQRIITDLRDLKPVVWCDWQLMTDQDPNWGLLPANYNNQTYYKAKSYYVRMQCSRFIKQGYTIIETNQGNTVAAINPQGTEMVLVVCNTGAATKNFSFDLQSFNSIGAPITYRTSAGENCVRTTSPTISGKQLSYTAPAESITTFVIPVTIKPQITGTFQIIARHSNKALQPLNTVAGSELIQTTDTDTEIQNWDIIPESSYYKIINKATGFALDVNQSSVDNGSSIIQWIYSGDDNQLWSLVDLGNGYFEVVNKRSNKSLDISNASTAENAKVIQYTFSNGFNQQFLIKAEVITHTTKEADIDENLFYSPNPFSESCNVKSKTPASYTITDKSGKLIEEGTIEKEQHVGGMLPTGVYTMVIKSGDSGNTRFIKLVKQ